MKINAAEQEFRDANWKLVGLRLLVFVRYWAKNHYHWTEGALFPSGKTPEDVACDVYVAFRQGDRKFADDVPMWVQLKSAAKSILWNLHALKEGKVTSAQEPSFFEPLVDGSADQVATLESEEFCTALIAGLYADQKVKKSVELTALVQAIESGADGVEELVKQMKFPKERVYELRRQLKPIAESVLKRLKKTENGYEQIESKNCRAAT